MTRADIDQERIERKLRVLEKASQYNFPTADIDQMLQEIKFDTMRATHCDVHG